MAALLGRCAAAPGGGGCDPAPVRPMDPLFAAVFRHAADLRLQVNDGARRFSPLALHLHPRAAAPPSSPETFEGANLWGPR
jgi:hypothetical protein